MTNELTQSPAKISAIKFDGYKIELSENKQGKPVARLFKFLTVGKNKGQYKLIHGYFFGTEARREEWINEQMSKIKERIKDQIDYKAKKKEATGHHDFKAGEALYSSWGYDQTNIDFFEIIEVLPKSVRIRPISQIMVKDSGGFMCENVKPALGSYIGEAITRPVKAYINSSNEANYYVSNGRHSLSRYTSGEKGVYQSHYA